VNVPPDEGANWAVGGNRNKEEKREGEKWTADRGKNIPSKGLQQVFMHNATAPIESIRRNTRDHVQNFPEKRSRREDYTHLPKKIGRPKTQLKT